MLPELAGEAVQAFLCPLVICNGPDGSLLVEI